MKIAVCGSMSSAEKMIEIKNDLEKMGHEVILPKDTENYQNGLLKIEDCKESTQKKIEQDLIRRYFKKISDCDAVLVVNLTKKGIKNYLGGNSFQEMSFGYVLEKIIFLLNPVPDMIYTDEIMAMQPIILNGDLSKIQ